MGSPFLFNINFRLLGLFYIFMLECHISRVKGNEMENMKQ